MLMQCLDAVEENRGHYISTAQLVSRRFKPGVKSSLFVAGPFKEFQWDLLNSERKTHGSHQTYFFLYDAVNNKMSEQIVTNIAFFGEKDKKINF